MAKDLEKTRTQLELFLREVEIRIRRYTMDRKLSDAMLDELKRSHADWLAVRREFYALGEPTTAPELRAIEEKILIVDRKIDIVQREIVSQKSFYTGMRTVLVLAAALIALALVYLWSHGVRNLDIDSFEPLAEWGPLKYLEVAFWAEFGVLCYLIFIAAHYMSRRDFDEWYQPWYLSTALRAPLLTVILMILVLEFAEWYAEGNVLETFALEDGNKFYFMAFLSFCLGIASDRTAAVMRELSESVADFAAAVANRIAGKLRTAVTPDRPVGK